jgi:hypothetical protein
MARVQRPPIQADIGTETVLLYELLRGVVTLLAKRLKWAEPELIDVTMMRFDVIANCRRRDNGALQAIFAKRMLEQLVLSDPRPASRRVPPIPLRWLAANAHGSIHRCRSNALSSTAR